MILTCLHGSARQVVIGHVRLKGKPKISTPYIFQIDKPRITKIGIGLLGPNLTPSAKFGSDQFTEGGATQPPFDVDFGFFLFLFFLVSLTGLQTESQSRF